ncbi:DNA-binding transcriptional MerR regulator [Nocardioides sp. BE266]|uniref:DICT sensory domain-containing protein n=1 Tax=Nocardioides sp. BE266 TaxID=2817725 RepID=UPI00285DAF74|nr:DICT sensory domain-containing protein [Nocardioides sp. BE266]MDR7252810.1 DNA-binding transcriptional MerR regulator [Nocardioides sp. BE266]
MDDGFSIGVLATRTGLTPAVLRAWETRFGFPAGERSPAGHRRFTEADVRRVREVIEVRDAGVPLQLAIDTVARRGAEEPTESVHAVLIRDFPELRPQRLGRPALVAASYAVEDESLARADRPVVLGAFQSGYHFGHARHRWDELARTASWCAVVAEFDDDLPAAPEARPARCQIADGSPMRREWVVVSVSAGFSAVVSAWEVPTRPGEEPEYEAVVSTHRPVALAAARVIAAAATNAGARPPAAVAELLDDVTPRAATAAVEADRVWLRALAHIDPPR